MKLDRKIAIAEQAITSISRHDDADLAVRSAALNRVIAIAERERQAAQERVQAQIDAAVPPPAQAQG